MGKYKNYFLIFLIITLIIMGIGCNKDNINNVSTSSTPTIMATPTPISSPALNDNDPNSITTTLASEDKADDGLNNYLCGKNEEVLFSFNTAISNKTVSLCVSKDQQDYIVYRYGTKNNIELEYPEIKDSASWSKFTYSYYMRGGGADNEGLDLNYLIFDNGGYEYQIYNEYSAEDDETKIGITVTNLETGDKTDIECKNDSVQGSLIDLRDNEKINIVLQ